MSTTALKSRLGDRVNGLNGTNSEGLRVSPHTSETSMSNNVDSTYIALNTNAMSIVNENLKNQPLNSQLFDTVKAPTGGMTAFSVPGLGGDEVQKELVGIVLDYATPRAYWSSPEPIEGTPPECFSRDSIVSHEGKACNTCLYNTFGSKLGESQAKACKEFVELYLLQKDSILPIIVRVPATSKFLFQRYLTRLVSKMIPLCGVVTKITLEKATSNGGQPYAKFNFEATEILSPDDTSLARAYGFQFSEMLDSGHEILDSPINGGGHH